MTATRRSTLPWLSAGLIALGLTMSPGPIAPQVNAQAPAIEPALLSSYRWRSIGPNRGGRSIAVSGVKGRPREATSAPSAAGCGRPPMRGKHGRR